MSSPTKSILIIGGSGFIGSHLALRLRDEYKVFATHYTGNVKIRGVTFIPLAINNRGWIKRIIHLSKPDVILYAAGERHAPLSQLEPGELDKVHSEGPANVLSCAESIQPRFIYLSSSYVFDGARGNYHETELALPGTPLGKAKLAGENYIRGRLFHSLIIRSGPLYGRSNGWNYSFLDHLRMHLDRGTSIEVDDHEIHTFTPVSGFVEMMAEIVAQNQIRNRVLHYGGLTKMTKYGFAQAFATRFGYDPKLIRKKAHVAARTGHDHPPDYSLNSTATVELLKLKPLLLEEGFDLVEKQLIAAP